MILRQRPSYEYNPIQQVIPLIQGVNQSNSISSYYDLVTNKRILSNTYNNYNIILNNILGLNMAIDNLSPTICDITQWPYITRLSNGTAQVRVNFKEARSTLSFNFNNISGGGSDFVIEGFQPNTIGALAWSYVEPLLQASGQNNLLNGLSYNPNVWSGDYNFSGVSHSNTATSSPQMAGVAITRRHLLFANHYAPNPGNIMTFINIDNVVYTRQIIAYNDGARQNLFNGFFNDLAVAVLDSDLPESIPHYDVVGDWIYKNSEYYIAGQQGVVFAWIGFKLDQYRNVEIAGNASLTPIQAIFSGATMSDGTIIPSELSYIETNFRKDQVLEGKLIFLDPYISRVSAQDIGGDSGSPRFIPVSPIKMVLAGCVTYSSGISSFPRKSRLDWLIASADANAGVATGYTVTEAPNPII